MSGGSQSRWHKVLLGEMDGTNAFQLKLLATEALAKGLRVVVLDPAGDWIAFADFFAGASYLLEAQVVRIDRHWRGAMPWAELSEPNAPLVIGFDDAPVEPGADFGALCEFIANDNHPHLLVIDGASSLRVYRRYVAALLEASRDMRVLASALDAGAANWLQALAPGLALVACDSSAAPQGGTAC